MIKHGKASRATGVHGTDTGREAPCQVCRGQEGEEGKEGERVNYIGILQTGDVDQAIMKAEELKYLGRHVKTERTESQKGIEYTVLVDRDG